MPGQGREDRIIVITGNAVFADKPTPLALVHDQELAVRTLHNTDRLHHAATPRLAVTSDNIYVAGVQTERTVIAVMRAGRGIRYVPAAVLTDKGFGVLCGHGTDKHKLTNYFGELGFLNRPAMPLRDRPTVLCPLRGLALPDPDDLEPLPTLSRSRSG